MKATNFEQANSTLGGGPAAQYGTADDVTDLPVYRFGGQIISCWKLSPLERAVVLVTGRVWLRVLADRTHFPVSVEGESPFSELLGERLLNWVRSRLAALSGCRCDVCGKPTPNDFQVCSSACGAELARRLSTN